MSRAHKHVHAKRRGSGRAVRRREAQHQERVARQETRQAAQMARQRPA